MALAIGYAQDFSQLSSLLSNRLDSSPACIGATGINIESWPIDSKAIRPGSFEPSPSATILNRRNAG